MSEDRSPKASNESAVVITTGRQRKKRKWDQPAEPLIPTGIAVPRVPLALNTFLLPGSVPISISSMTNPVPTTYVSTRQFVQTTQSPAVPQTTAAIIQKLNQPKIQDELIAREIVINDAEPTVRYKLTKRQTQEEIQKYTGAVVITRGKYHPPNGLPDSEMPLYLHISAGAHLKDTAERIKAVDLAAAMVEEILKQGQSQTSSLPPHSVLLNGQVAQTTSACLFLGFDADTSLNIAARIRGPNDLYVNHIMNETGATVVLRGWGSEHLDNSHSEETTQPLHLYLSSTNPRSLEAAKVLAENLLDTIASECGATRILSNKVYGAVPPPQQLLTETENTPKAVSAVNTNQAAVISPTAVGSTAPAQSLVPNGPPISTVTGTTCYNGYEGIYPQATPLQQMALALRQASASSASVSSTSSFVTTEGKSNSIAEADTRPQKRKFKELPATSNGLTAFQNSQQGSEFLKPGLEDSGLKDFSLMLSSKELVDTESNGMAPLPQRNMPPPQPRFSSLRLLAKIENNVLKEPSAFPGSSRNMPPPSLKFSEAQLPPKAKSENEDNDKSTTHLSDTLLKLAEYGEDDEEMPVASSEVPESIPTRNLDPKPFWAA